MGQSVEKTMNIGESIGRPLSGLILSAILLLTACDSHEPPEGRVNLRLLETLGAAQEGFQPASFQLENESTASIWLTGGVNSQGIVQPAGMTTVECQPIDSPGWVDEGPFTGSFEKSDAIEIAPGQKVQLLADIGFSLKHKGGRCRLRVELRGGLFIVSEYFSQ